MSRRILSLTAWTLSIFLLAACTTARMISRESRSQRTGVFTEVSGSEAAPAGYADLIIKAHIKTHLKGYYPLEEDRHGKPGYPFVINIDGQAVTWKVNGVLDRQPEYKEGGGEIYNPEAGEGMMYTLEKTIRLAVGPHKVFFGLPVESYDITTDIDVTGGEVHVLEFKPFYKEPYYKYEPNPPRPSFLTGISYYEVSFK